MAAWAAGQRATRSFSSSVCVHGRVNVLRLGQRQPHKPPQMPGHVLVSCLTATS